MTIEKSCLERIVFNFAVFILFFFITSAGIASLRIADNVKRCGQNYQCDNGVCVNANHVCDGVDDCGDNSDENANLCEDLETNNSSIQSEQNESDVILQLYTNQFLQVEEMKLNNNSIVNALYNPGSGMKIVTYGYNNTELDFRRLDFDLILVPRNLRKNNSVHVLFTQAEPKSPNSDIIFRFHSRRLPWGVEIDLNSEFVKSFLFEKGSETKILIHDYHNEEINLPELRFAYLWQTKEKPNVITVDYSRCLKKESLFLHSLAQNVTEAVHRLLQQLQAKGFREVHLIGLGLGAHIAGAATNNLSFVFTRVTGLDPIAFGFDEDNSLPRISVESADFVDIILTNTDRFGSKEVRGHIDFYPNGGGSQPECDMFTSHMRSYHYFVESVISPTRFLSYQASSWRKFLINNTSDVEYMGEYVSMKKYGPFYLFVDYDNSTEIVHEPTAVTSDASSEPCAENNGGCDQICENKNNRAVCSCFGGFDIQENGRDCKQGLCTYRIMKRQGTIQSPYFPLHYPTAAHCYYNLITNPGCHIALTVGFYQLEDCCHCDYIKIYDGNSSQSSIVKTICGEQRRNNNNTATIVSTANNLFVAFHTDSSESAAGFSFPFSTECDH